MPDESRPSTVVEPLPSLRPLSPLSVVSAKSDPAVAIKIEVDVKPTVPKKRKRTFPRRAIADEEEILRKFESGGFDEEDLGLLRAAFEQLRQNDETPWAHKLCWLNPPSVPSGSSESAAVKPSGRRSARKSEDVVVELMQHKTGCARTEGYYKLSHKQKRSLIRRAECTFERTAVQSEQDVTAARQQVQAGREARSMQRRILTSLGTD
uniref:COMPASS complex Set1 subunit N-SET domain-containing protein n=1 Tax=Plectus sambesii TaxID=2011161 RepID=A0A914VJ10_9BILA